MGPRRPGGGGWVCVPCRNMLSAEPGAAVVLRVLVSGGVLLVLRMWDVGRGTWDVGQSSGLREHASGEAASKAAPLMLVGCASLTSGTAAGCHGGLRLLMLRINAQVPGDAKELRHLAAAAFPSKNEALSRSGSPQ